MFVQFKLPFAAAVATGGVVFCVTATFAVLEQLFAVLITVKLYVPPTLVVGFWLEEVNPPGPVQLKLLPVVVPPFKVTVVVVQFKLPVTDAVAPGAVVFWVTAIIPVVKQPFPGSVTV